MYVVHKLKSLAWCCICCLSTCTTDCQFVRIASSSWVRGGICMQHPGFPHPKHELVNVNELCIMCMYMSEGYVGVTKAVFT